MVDGRQKNTYVVSGGVEEGGEDVLRCAGHKLDVWMLYTPSAAWVLTFVLFLLDSKTKTERNIRQVGECEQVQNVDSVRCIDFLCTSTRLTFLQAWENSTGTELC